MEVNFDETDSYFNHRIKKKEIELAKGNLLQVLADISFDVEQQEFVSIVGPSGSRKNNIALLYF